MPDPKQFDKTQTFETWNDPYGNRLISVNRDGTISAKGIAFPDGTYQATANSGGFSNPDMGTF